MLQKISSEWQLPQFEEWSGNSRPVAAVLFGVLACSGSVMVLFHGLGLGSYGSAAVLIGPIVVLILIGRHRNTLLDSVFALFAFWIALSSVVNGFDAPRKEYALLALTLLAYIAARRAGAAGWPFFALIGTVGALGIGFTVAALAAQWSDPHGKPLVFGFFDAAPAQFFICFALLLLGLVASNLRTIWLACGYAICSIAFVVLAASIVRFSFLALAGTLLCEAVLCRRTRFRALAGVLILLGSAATGIGLRSETFHRMTENQIVLVAYRDDCVKPNFKIDTSLKIRLEILKDAVAALPRAGFFGSGLYSFPTESCVGLQTHVTVAQVIIEFGWPAGLLLACLVLGALASGLSLARPEARFAMMGLLFASALTFAHGDLGRDGLLFLFLGYLARISERPV